MASTCGRGVARVLDWDEVGRTITRHCSTESFAGRLDDEKSDTPILLPSRLLMTSVGRARWTTADLLRRAPCSIADRPQAGCAHTFRDESVRHRPSACTCELEVARVVASFVGVSLDFNQADVRVLLELIGDECDIATGCRGR